MRMTVKISGLSALRADADATKAAVRGGLVGALHEAAYIVEGRAKALVLEPPKTGRLYKRGKKTTHQASAPGEAPASDTGNLAGSITQDVSAFDLECRVSAETPYAEALEYGTTKMEPRPFMRRALTESEDLILEAVVDHVKRSIL